MITSWIIRLDNFLYSVITNFFYFNTIAALLYQKSSRKKWVRSACLYHQIENATFDNISCHLVMKIKIERTIKMKNNKPTLNLHRLIHCRLICCIYFG